MIVARFMGLVGDSQITRACGADAAGRAIRGPAGAQLHRRAGLSRSSSDSVFSHRDGCTDAEFLRRASLDTHRALPTPEEARAFLADPAPDKREKLDRAPARASRFTPISGRTNGPICCGRIPIASGIKSVYLLDQWLRESFRANKPLRPVRARDRARRRQHASLRARRSSIATGASPRI